MARRMLDRCLHPEETQWLSSAGTKLTEFDFETASRKPLKGNIYLAKGDPHRALAAGRLRRVRRQPPLAFSPSRKYTSDYFQIPVADREKLIAECSGSRTRKLEHRSERFDWTDIDDAWKSNTP